MTLPQVDGGRRYVAAGPDRMNPLFPLISVEIAVDPARVEGFHPDVFDTIKKLLKRREFWIASALGAALAAVAVIVAIKSGVNSATLKTWFDQFILIIRDKPLALYLSIVVLPALPVPVSPMLVAAGLVYLPAWGAPLAFLYGFSAVLLNMSWVWWVSAYPGRRLAAKLLARLDVRLDDPENPKPRIPLLIFLRVTPGVPFFLQNVLLGFLRVPYLPYILISGALNSVFTFGFIVLPGAMMKGQFGLVLAAVAVVIVGVAGIRWMRSRLPQPDKIKQDLKSPAPPAGAAE